MEREKDQTGEGMGIVVGPWGGNGGTNWDDGYYNSIREITLMYTRCIDSIRVVYDKNGKPVLGEKHGGVGGTRTAEIKLQLPEEYLTAVHGYYSPVVHGGSPVIRSLTFKSNKRTFGPYGIEEGTPFSFPMQGGQIVGFKGKCGWYLDSIGFHISKVKTEKVKQTSQQSLFRRLTSSVSLVGPRDGDETRPKSCYSGKRNQRQTIKNRFLLPNILRGRSLRKDADNRLLCLFNDWVEDSLSAEVAL